MSADSEALAAEYVLGTLDSAERVQAQNLLALDQAFAAKVRVWERRLGELHLMVEPVEPDSGIWQRIKTKTPRVTAIAEAEPANAEPEAPLEPVAPLEPETQPEAAEPAAPPTPPAEESALSAAANFDAVLAAVTEPFPPAEPSSDPVPLPAEAAPRTLVAPALSPASETPAAPFQARVPSEAATQVPQRAAPGDATVRLRRRLRRWRAVAALMTLVVLALVALVGVWRFAPHRLPPMLQPAELMQLVGISVGAPSTAPRPPAPVGSEYEE